MTQSPAPAERRPEPTPSRIAPLSSLPLFHNLEGRKVVLTGATDPTLWKAELLLSTGSNLAIFAGSDEGAERFRLLADRATVLPRRWSETDLTGAALAIHGEESGADEFAAAARARGIPVNVIDNPEHSDFTFGTIVNRSPLVIGIFSGGGAPMLGQSIRERLEALLPAQLSSWARAAHDWRPTVKTRIGGFEERRRFWRRFVDRVWTEGHRAPASDDRDELLGGHSSKGGEVILVGAGPGDPALLTLGALRALQRASVILYDDLVSAEVLELARREARRVAVGKKGYGLACSQADINAQVVDLALSGETVVRLKGGDPLIFGRAGEELDACREADIPVSIIPGISAGQAAGAAIGVSLTERNLSRRVQFVTAHGADGKLPTDIDWNTIADAQATTIVYMPRRNIGGFVDKALSAGLDPATPTALVASASLPDEQRLFGSVADLPRLVDTLDAAAPLTIIIGQVARERSAALAASRAAA